MTPSPVSPCTQGPNWATAAGPHVSGTRCTRRSGLGPGGEGLVYLEPHRSGLQYRQLAMAPRRHWATQRCAPSTLLRSRRGREVSSCRYGVGDGAGVRADGEPARWRGHGWDDSDSDPDTAANAWSAKKWRRHEGRLHVPLGGTLEANHDRPGQELDVGDADAVEAQKTLECSGDAHGWLVLRLFAVGEPPNVGRSARASLHRPPGLPLSARTPSGVSEAEVTHSDAKRA